MAINNKPTVFDPLDLDKKAKAQEKISHMSDRKKDKLALKVQRHEEQIRVNKEYCEAISLEKKAKTIYKAAIHKAKTQYSLELKESKIPKKDARINYAKARANATSTLNDERKRIYIIYQKVLNSKLSYKFKKWFLGVGKEFRRVSWISRNRVFQDFAIIVVLVGIMALIFLGIDAILSAAHVIG